MEPKSTPIWATLPAGFHAGEHGWLRLLRWKLIMWLAGTDAICLNINHSVLKIESRQFLLNGCDNKIEVLPEMKEVIIGALPGWKYIFPTARS